MEKKLRFVVSESGAKPALVAHPTQELNPFQIAGTASGSLLPESK